MDAAKDKAEELFNQLNENETVKEAKEKLGEAVDTAKEKFEEFGKALSENENVQQAREKIDEAVDVARDKAADLAKDAAEVADKVMEDVKKSGFFQKLKDFFCKK